MTRPHFACALSLALLAACARPTPMPDVFPDTLAGWRRTSLSDLPPAQPPDPVPPAAIQQIRAATYDGPGKLDVRVYALSTSAVALDVVQRWAPRPDTVFFYNDRFFVVVHWQVAEKKALPPFLTALQHRFKAR